ncbi:HMG box domain-containing protein [Entamoeba marina]
MSGATSTKAPRRTVKKQVQMRKPKRTNKNPYVRYCKEKREEMKEKNPSLKPIEINKKLSEQWGALTEEQKSAYRPKPRAPPKREKKEAKK